MHSNTTIGFSDADSASLCEIVAEIEKTQATIASAQVAQTRALARAGELARAKAAGSRANVRTHDMVLRTIAAEVGGVMHLTDRSVQRQIGDATELVDDYPATLDAWEAGVITRSHVRVITETGGILPVERRSEFESEALQRCGQDTAGRVRGALELLAERLHPRTLAERHRDARLRRQVRVLPGADGMSELSAIMPTLLADAIYDRLTQQAKAVVDARTQAAAELRAEEAAAAAARKAAEASSLGSSAADSTVDGPTPDVTADAATPERPVVSDPASIPDPTGAPADDPCEFDDERLGIAADTRSTDEIRADLLADMLLTAAPGADPTRTDDGPGTLGAIRAKVQIIVPALTLLGKDDDPALLVGRSPIDPDTARAIAGATRCPWERVLTHPVTGAVLHVDTYHRSAAIDRFLRARDQRCRFPGCRRPAVHCEVDHTHDYALGGATDVCNLAHLCQRHHTMKQFTPWQVRQLGSGTLEWTSPLGRIYIDEPPSLGVQFRPLHELRDPDPPSAAASSDAPF